MSEKRCRVCGAEKPLREFYRSAGMRDGHRHDCITCNLARRAERYRADPAMRARAIERAKQWQADNPERYAAQQRKAKESGAYQQALRKSHLKRKYGMTTEQYDERLAAQGGGCVLCGTRPPDGNSLHVDHDHETGRIRGLLCFNCNAGLGKFADDPELLSRAAGYVGVHRRIAALMARR